MDDGQLRIAATLYSKVGDHDSNVKAARCLSELLSQRESPQSRISEATLTSSFATRTTIRIFG